MILFVVARSGGIDGKFFQNIASFFRNHVDSTRTSVPAPVYSALANFPHQFLALAIYQAAWSCPVEAVQAGVCKGVSAAEINLLAKSIDPKSRQIIEEADDILATARSDLVVVGIHDECDSTRLCKIFARLDVSMARLVLNKLQGKSKEKLLTPLLVARQFVGDLREAYPDINLAHFDGKFPAAVAADQPSLVASEKEVLASAGKLALYEQDSRGKVVDPLALLRSKGFDIGSHSAAKETYVMHQIVAIESEATGSIVVLRNSSDSSLARRVALADFMAGWELRDLKNLVELHAGWPAKRPSTSDACKSLAGRGVVFYGLAHLMMTTDFGADGKVAIYSKPVRKVEATCHSAVRTLGLLPESTAVKMLPRGEIPPAGAAEVRFVPDSADYKYYLMPCTAGDSVAPYWCINTTAKADEANMSYASVEVTCMAAHDFSGKLLPGGDRPESVVAPVPVAAPVGKGRGKAPKAPKASKAKAGAAVVSVADVDGDGEARDDRATHSRLIFPYLLNTKPLSKGEELLVYKAAAPLKRALEAVQPIGLAALAKRAKATY
jgi:hypothetical protein